MSKRLKLIEKIQGYVTLNEYINTYPENCTQCKLLDALCKPTGEGIKVEINHNLFKDYIMCGELI